jgi:hypothetical protein
MLCDKAIRETITLSRYKRDLRSINQDFFYKTLGPCPPFRGRRSDRKGDKTSVGAESINEITNAYRQLIAIFYSSK